MSNIIRFPATKLERALLNACHRLNRMYDHDLCPDDLFFGVMEKLDSELEKRKKENG